MAHVIMHVDMNAFFASVEQATNPLLRDKPIAVIGSKSRTVVLTASYPAKAWGVQTGATIYEARRRCPDIRLVTSNPDKYMDTSRRLMDLFGRFTPLVEICSIDEAFLDVSGSLYLFGSAEEIARRIKREIAAQFQLTCSIGIAPNKLMAKLAANLRKPDGLVTILPQQLPGYLEAIPVDNICGIGPRITEFLRTKGIATCGQLQRIPRRYLVRHYGVLGDWLHHAAHGRDNSPLICAGEEEDPKSVGHSMTLAADVTTRQSVELHLQHLSEMVGRRLRAGQFSGTTVTVTVRFASFTTAAMRHTFQLPLWYGRDIYAAAQVVWGMMRMPEPVRLVGVSVSNLRKDERQLSLFPDEQRKERVTTALDQVNNKFGEFTIFPAAVLVRSRRERTIAPSWRPYGIRQAIRR
jgi:DNA polymerase-4